jgi:hypothetical protein
VVENGLVAELPVVMATAQPRPARWRCRGDALRNVLGDPAVPDLAERLGYDRDGSGWV